MKGFLMMVVGGLGLGALLRRRRRHPVVELGPDPAAELRAKLAESKSAADGEAGAEPEPARDDLPPDPQSRRTDVHERARATIDELR
jgi:hypothetical protein